MSGETLSPISRRPRAATEATLARIGSSVGHRLRTKTLEHGLRHRTNSPMVDGPLANVIEFTRACSAIDVGHGLGARDVVATPERLC